MSELENNTSFYSLLGIEETCTPDEIKKAYRKVAMILHPDKNKEDNANVVFHQLTAAYEVLMDDKKREIYDQSRKEEQYLSKVKPAVSSDVLLSEFNFDEEHEIFQFDCRCGHTFSISIEDIPEDITEQVVSCDGCSLNICVRLDD